VADEIAMQLLERVDKQRRLRVSVMLRAKSLLFLPQFGESSVRIGGWMIWSKLGGRQRIQVPCGQVDFDGCVRME
jgi:hypothetical protein